MKTLGDVIIIDTGEQLNKSDMLPEAQHPVVNGGIDFSGYTNKYNCEANTITISQGGASAGYVNWLDKKFWAGAHCYVVTPLDGNDVRFLYHFIKSCEYNFMTKQQGAGIPSLNRSEVYKIPFPEFDYKKQQEIADYLDTFSSMIMNLEAELSTRKKQYAFYGESIFSNFQKEAKWVNLGEVCEVFDGVHQTPVYVEDGVKFVSVENIDNIYSTKKQISQEAFNKLSCKPQIGDLFMTRITAGIIGQCAIVDQDEKLGYYVSLALLRPHADLQSKYLKLYLHSNVGKAELTRYIKKTATPPKINKGDISKVRVLMFSKEKQQQIVSTLEIFEALISNIKQELEARQKQYEYYREKLLTFE